METDRKETKTNKQNKKQERKKNRKEKKGRKNVVYSEVMRPPSPQNKQTNDWVKVI